MAENTLTIDPVTGTPVLRHTAANTTPQVAGSTPDTGGSLSGVAPDTLFGLRPGAFSTIKQTASGVPQPKLPPEMDATETANSLTSDSLDIGDSGDTSAMRDANITAGATGAMSVVEANERERQALLESEQKRIEELNKNAQGIASNIDDASSARDVLTDVDSNQLKQTEFEKNLARLGVDLKEVTSLSSEVAKLSGDLDRLKLEEADTLEEARRRGESTAFASGQVTQERLRYAREKAYLATELGARAMLLQALQGNVKMADSMASEFVDNAFADRQLKLDNLNDFIDRNEDLLDELNKEEAAILKEARSREAQALEEDKDMAKENVRMMNADPAAYRASGLTVEDIKSMSSAEFADKMAQHSTRGTGDGFSPTSTQIGKGAANAGMSIDEFTKLPIDEQNAWINGTKKLIKDDDIAFEAEGLVFEDHWGTKFAFRNSTKLEQAKKAAIEDVNRGGTIYILDENNKEIPVNLDDMPTRQRLINAINNLTLEDK